EAGAGGTSLDWSLVFPRLAEHTTVCAYDRAGLGWSESGPGPRDLKQLAAEAEALLTAADLPQPLILVGHSFGGMVSLELAASRNLEVAGLVLVDSVHPNLAERLPAGYSAAVDQQLSMLRWGARLHATGLPRLLFPPLRPPGLPSDIEPAATANGYRAATYRTAYREARSFAENPPDRPALPLDLPLTVLSRDRPETWPPNLSADDAEMAWRQMQIELAALSRDSTHHIVEGAGHFLSLEDPEAVAAAVLEQVERARSAQTVTAAPRTEDP
ncbi:MAG: alpha/beta hydrolase, partial [Acidobacteriota bacterium]